VSAKLCGVKGMTPRVFGRATITLGIGPHCSLNNILNVLFGLYRRKNGGGICNSVFENNMNTRFTTVVKLILACVIVVQHV